MGETVARHSNVVLTHPRLDCPCSTRKTAPGQRRGPGSNGSWAASTLDARHAVIGKRNVLREYSDLLFVNALRSLIWPFLRSEEACRLLIRSLVVFVPVERSCSVPYSGLAGTTKKKDRKTLRRRSRDSATPGGVGALGTSALRYASLRVFRQSS